MKLDRNALLQLQEYSTKQYLVKLYRLCEPEPILVWEGLTVFYVFLSSHTKQLLILTPQAYDWAEYSYQDIQENGDCVVEDYLMEVYDAS